ncbi:MAG: twin-arginine translocase subunit TatC [Bacteroidia bacterium]
MALDQDEIDDKEMSFFDHLDTLRKHVIRSAYAIVIFSVLGFVFMDFIFHQVILGPLRNNFISYKIVCAFSHFAYKSDQFCIKHLNYELINTEMTGQFMMSFKLAFLTGIILSMPFLLWQLWLFIKPALSRKEKSRTKGFVFYTTFLFFCGISFGYLVLCPISVNFLSSYSLSPIVENKIVITSVVSFLTLLVLGSGLIFELPIIMYFLARIGIISADFLKKYRKHAFVVILLLSALLTPPDVVSQIVLTIPLYSLFELGITIVKRVEKNKAKLDG